MSRYSPTVQPTAPSPLNAALAGLLQGGRDAIDRKRERELQDEELDYTRSRRSAEGAATEAELYGSGVRHGAAPTRETEVRAPAVFGGERPGMARGSSGRSPLVEDLGAMARQGRPRTPQIVAPAGAFVPGMGFVPRNLTDQDLMAGAQVGMAAPQTREEVDPRYRQLNEDYYLDTEATPEAVQSRAEAARRQRLTRVLEALQAGGRDPETIASAIEAGVPEEMYQDEEQRGPTEEELRRAGVPERSIPAALRDPTLARQLVDQYNRPASEGSDPYNGLGRDQYFKDYEERERIRRSVADEFDDRDGDPRLAERRKALVEAIGAPRSSWEQNAIDALARGVDRDTILLRMEDLVESGDATEDELVELERYLDPYKLER